MNNYNTMFSHKRTPYFLGSTEVVMKKIAKKYLRLRFEELTNPQIAGAIRAAGSDIENLVHYIFKKYGKIKQLDRVKMPVTAFPKEAKLLDERHIADETVASFMQLNFEDFRDFDEDLLIDFLQIHGERNFEIILQRDWEDNDELNRTQFLAAAYGGDMLSGDCEQFSYLVPSRFSKNPIRFYMISVNVEGIASTLAFMIEGYFRKDKDRAAHYFQAAQEFMDASYDNTIGCETWGLLEQAGRICM